MAISSRSIGAQIYLSIIFKIQEIEIPQCYKTRFLYKDISRIQKTISDAGLLLEQGIFLNLYWYQRQIKNMMDYE